MVKIPNLPGVKILRALKLSYCNGVRITAVRVCLFKSSVYLHVWNLFDGFCLFFLNYLFWNSRSMQFWILAKCCMAWKWKCVSVPVLSPWIHILIYKDKSFHLESNHMDYTWDDRKRLSIFRSPQTRILSSFPLIRSLKTLCYLVILWCAKAISSYFGEIKKILCYS